MVDWSNGLSIQGETDMSSVTYVDDYITDDNRAVVVNANKTISFDAPIPASCFPTFLFQPSSNFNGQIMALEGDDQNAVLSYDNSIDKFIFSVTNLNLGTTISTIVETDVQELESNKAYLIGYAEGKVYVREYATISQEDLI